VEPGLRRVERSDLGFALRLPADWRDEPVDPFTGPQEVARFRSVAVPGDMNGGTRVCRVYRRDFSRPISAAVRVGDALRPGLVAHAVAGLHAAWLARHGFRHFRLRAAMVGGRPAARLDFDRTHPHRGVWECSQYFVAVGDHGFSLSFGTWAKGRDAMLPAALAGGFELLGSSSLAP
jgi:hypothetical protein